MARGEKCLALVWAGVAAIGAFAQTPSRGPAYVLIDLASHRTIAQARPELLDTPLAPGSVIKIATLIAALEDGAVFAETRIICRRTTSVDGTPLTCVHPDLHRPLGPAEALGHSCNGFFANVAQRVRRTSLDAVLVRLGLAPLSPAAPMASGAIGLAGIRQTPRALLEAFVRVAGAPAAFRMPDAARAIVRDGLRLAATTGTASAFGEAGIRALAKTGTAPMPGGGYHGLVVAAVPDLDPKYGIVVLVPGGAGADAAAIAVEVLRTSGVTAPGLPAPSRAEGSPALPQTIRVGITRRGGGVDISTMPFESYVARVVAGEMDAPGRAAATEALAISVRTFAAANLGRHRADGFDLCDLTHCQVIGRATPATEAAATATAGLVLLDQGRPAPVFYSAWCGGHTELPSRVWAGAADPPYLPSKPDTACAADAPWVSEAPEPELRRALLSAGLKGSLVTSLSVVRRTPSGRAAELRVGGMVPDTIDANLFRTIVGRLLGWHVVKSTRFDVRQTASGFALTGTGLGHGVGLCVRGAAARAGQGATREAILAAYYPGLVVGRVPAPAGGRTSTRPIVRVVLPEADRRWLGDVRDVGEKAVTDMAARLGVAAPPEIEFRFHPTMEAYSRATGLPWWTSARTTGARVDLVPLEALRQRGTLAATMKHEAVHVMADTTLAGRPLWVREGLAIVMAGELGPAAAPAAPGPSCPSDVELRAVSAPDAWRRAYQAAGRCVRDALAAGRRWQDLR